MSEAPIFFPFFNVFKMTRIIDDVIFQFTVLLDLLKDILKPIFIASILSKLTEKIETSWPSMRGIEENVLYVNFS